MSPITFPAGIAILRIDTSAACHRVTARSDHPSTTATGASVHPSPVVSLWLMLVRHYCLALAAMVLTRTVDLIARRGFSGGRGSTIRTEISTLGRLRGATTGRGQVACQQLAAFLRGGTLRQFAACPDSTS
jgi:hypothetical protein